MVDVRLYFIICYFSGSGDYMIRKKKDKKLNETKYVY